MQKIRKGDEVVVRVGIDPKDITALAFVLTDA